MGPRRIPISQNFRRRLATHNHTCINNTQNTGFTYHASSPSSSIRPLPPRLLHFAPQSLDPSKTPVKDQNLSPLTMEGHHHFGHGLFGHHHQPPPPASGHVPPTVKIFCRANENYCLTARDGQVVLAPANPRDAFQVIKSLMSHVTFSFFFFFQFVDFKSVVH
jgi:hypothetical protein